MSDSPPPFDDPINKKKEQVNESTDDLFFSTIGEPSSSTTPTNDDKQLQEDMDDIFSPKQKKEISASLDATNEIRLDDNDDNSASNGDNDLFSSNRSSIEQPFSLPNKSASINIQPTITTPPATTTAPVPIVTPSPPPPTTTSTNTTTTTTSSASGSSSQLSSQTSVKKPEPLIEDDEDRDKFIEIKVSDPIKVGDGMSSYMVYKVTTKTNYPGFKKTDLSSNRRFSDFLNLYEKLKEKHLHNGRFLPAAPEKDMFGTTKVKMASNKDEAQPNDFLERRRAALERFLNRLGRHPTYKYDPDFRDFLEIAEDLPKANNTSALSGASVMKMFKNVGEAMNKMSIKIPQTDQWFDEKTHEIENLHAQFKRLHSSIETLCGWRKDLAYSTKEFAKSVAVLANSEEHTNLAKALTQLGDVHEKIEQLEFEQSHDDFFVMSELLKDYIGLLDSIKEVFYQRVKAFHNWQKAEETLKTKQDAKTKLESTNKQDKIPAILAEIRDWETKVEKGKEEFELISKTIKEEMNRFEVTRIREFKNSITKYLTNLLERQEALVKIWEQYLPEVKAI